MGAGIPCSHSPIIDGRETLTWLSLLHVSCLTRRSANLYNAAPLYGGCGTVIIVHVTAPGLRPFLARPMLQPCLQLLAQRVLEPFSPTPTTSPSFRLLPSSPIRRLTEAMSYDNPYTKAPPVAKAPTLGAKDPLIGFLPRKVTGEQVKKAMVRHYRLLCRCMVRMNERLYRKASSILSRSGHTLPSTRRSSRLGRSSPSSVRWTSFSKWYVSFAVFLSNEGRSESASGIPHPGP